MVNDGFVNEEKLKEYINSKTYSDYNPNIQKFLFFTFGKNFDSSKTFVAKKKTGQIKPDLSIIHNGIEKCISVKKGSGNSVHQEKIDVFFPYVETLIDTNTLNKLKKFHYGDNTINDTGVIRYTAAECKNKYSKEISYLNSKFNHWDKLESFLERFLFIGNVGTLSVDIIYHGTIDDGLWATKDEIKKYIKNNTFCENVVHFGPLTYQVWGRNEKRKAKHPDRRYVMQIKWGSLAKDLKKIRKVV